MWIDCHAHCDRLPEKELPELLAEATTAGVSTVLSTATDLSSAVAVVRQCRTFAGLYGAVGISPFDALSLPVDWKEQLEAHLDNEKIVAVGEIGLDRSNQKYPSFEFQLPVYTHQLRIAWKHDLPVVVHSRGAEQTAAEICRSSGIKKAMFHCFTGGRDALRYILESGYYVSFSGIITFSREVAELAIEVPLDRLLIETDSPYLAPVPHRGKTNRPAWVALVGEAVAQCKGVPSGELQSGISRNFERLFLPH
jgi:TatD DNase family protein